ncbi:hypothetical protein RHSIM_Rhsim10G0194200 [Rhododendron simsii]|uniref:non-specific serine/threonine protein kinase n=1 Tax=Rhododendron simsii TaxID=118357 RepID=A0A834LA98_RHOSS|nr:hypothetical protein RHSIM_Rhsim10G0194200 [Rhododendron simsii]
MSTSSKKASSSFHTLRRALLLPFRFVSLRVCIFLVRVYSFCSCLIPNVPNALHIILNFCTIFRFFPVDFYIFLGCLITSSSLHYTTKYLLGTGAGILVMTVFFSPDESVDGSDEKLNQGVDESVDGCTIGKLFVSNTEIALGSNGTIVLEGTYEGRPVAVKRLVKVCHDVASKEHRNLCVTDSHPNIVRLYGKESNRDFVYLALERCYQILCSWVKFHLMLFLNENCVTYNLQVQDMVSGLVHLHGLGMVHRDLKPQNVLIVKEGYVCAKLSDMGISKRLLHYSYSNYLISSAVTGCGTSGWQAPELLLRGRQTRAIDVFSLGCVLFYCITSGKHPFGGRLERDMNIVNGKVKLFLVKHIPEAVDLFSHLLDQKAELRPKASEVLIHPMFWDSDKRLSFLRDASDRVQQKDFRHAILKELEHRAPRVLGIIPGSVHGKTMDLLEWDKKIDAKLLNDNDKARCYCYDRVHDLLRFIRNKKSHFFELPREIQVISHANTWKLNLYT